LYLWTTAVEDMENTTVAVMEIMESMTVVVEIAVMETMESTVNMLAGSIKFDVSS
jgi:hypothetical protein